MSSSVSAAWMDQLTWSEDGLVAAIAQDVHSGEVLMLAWMNREALACTVQEKRAVYWSRSRKCLWRKGEQSGNVQYVHALCLDCDGDAVVVLVDTKAGAACHTGHRHCFFRSLEQGAWQETNDAPLPAASFASHAVLAWLQQRIAASQNTAAPSCSYVAQLHQQGLNKMLEKLGEEATECIIAAKDAQRSGETGEVVAEMADVWFHSMVMLEELGISYRAVLEELHRRLGTSGLQEKASRFACAQGDGDEA